MPVQSIEQYRTIRGAKKGVGLGEEEAEIVYLQDLGGPHLRTSWNITNALVTFELPKPFKVVEKKKVIIRAKFLLDGIIPIGEGEQAYTGVTTIPAKVSLSLSFFNPPIVWGGHSLTFTFEVEYAEGVGNLGMTFSSLTGVMSYNLQDFHGNVDTTRERI